MDSDESCDDCSVYAEEFWKSLSQLTPWWLIVYRRQLQQAAYLPSSQHATSWGQMITSPFCRRSGAESDDVSRPILFAGPGSARGAQLCSPTPRAARPAPPRPRLPCSGKLRSCHNGTPGSIQLVIGPHCSRAHRPLVAVNSSLYRNQCHLHSITVGVGYFANSSQYTS